MTSLPSTTRHGKAALLSDYGKVAGLLTTASVPAAQRLEFWREVVCHTIAGVEANALVEKHPYAGTIQARSIPLAHMPSFDLVHVEADPQRVNRTRELISIQTEPTWLLMVQEEGTCTIRQGEQQATLKPGDIGFLDDEGYLYIVDRKKDMIVTGGENVFPTEVEGYLYRDHNVLEAAVFGVPDSRWVERVVAAVVLKPGSRISAEELINGLRGKLAPYKCPKSIFFVATLPKSAAGKILRKKLRNECGQLALSSDQYR